VGNRGLAASRRERNRAREAIDDWLQLCDESLNWKEHATQIALVGRVARAAAEGGSPGDAASILERPYDVLASQAETMLPGPESVDAAVEAATWLGAALEVTVEALCGAGDFRRALVLIQRPLDLLALWRQGPAALTGTMRGSLGNLVFCIGSAQIEAQEEPRQIFELFTKAARASGLSREMPTPMGLAFFAYNLFVRAMIAQDQALASEIVDLAAHALREQRFLDALADVSGTEAVDQLAKLLAGFPSDPAGAAGAV
jgi:hypothetical protein